MSISAHPVRIHQTGAPLFCALTPSTATLPPAVGTAPRSSAFAPVRAAAGGFRISDQF